MVNKLPVKRGISSPALINIPEKWSAEWFRSFITQFLVDIDLRNAVTSGITIAGNVSGNNSPQVGTPVTAGLSPIPNNTVLGNVSGGTATPTALTAAQLSGITTISFSPGIGSYSMTGEIAVLKIGSGGGPTSLTLTSASFVPAPGDIDYGYASFGGSISPTSVGGYTISALFSSLDTVAHTYGDEFRVLSASNPGSALFTSITVGTTTRSFSTATYTYTSGTAIWHWSGSPDTNAWLQSTGSVSVSIS